MNTIASLPQLQARIACDVENAHIAIAHDGGITVIAFDIAAAAPI